MKIKPLALISLVTAVLLWGSAFPVIKIALVDYSPIDLGALRFISSSLFLVLFACIRGIQRPALKDLPLFFGIAAIGIVGYQLLLNVGELYTSAGASGFIVSVSPIFTLLLCALFFKEKLTSAKMLGAVIALMGVWFISTGSGNNPDIYRGITVLLIASIAWSLFFILQKLALKRYDSLTTTCYAVWIATLLFLIINTPQTTLTSVIQHHHTSLYAAIYLGVFCTSIAYWLWAYTLTHIQVSKAAIGTYAIPFISMILSHVMLQEQYSIHFVFGSLLMVFGILTATVFRFSWPKIGKPRLPEASENI